MWISSRKERWNKSNLLRLFLISAFPFHLWTLFLVLRDLNWIAHRTDIWDAIGVGAYAMMYALVESSFFFLLMAALYLSLPGSWGRDKSLAQSGVMALWIPLLAGIHQVYRYKEFTSPGFLVEALFATGHPLRFGIIGAAVLAAVIVGLVIIPSYLIIFKERARERIIEGLERITILSVLYLVLDVIGLVIIAVRNLS